MVNYLINIDRATPLVLPPDLRDWVPADHLAYNLKRLHHLGPMLKNACSHPRERWRRTKAAFDPQKRKT
jgi:hypothetical protein